MQSECMSKLLFDLRHATGAKEGRASGFGRGVHPGRMHGAPTPTKIYLGNTELSIKIVLEYLLLSGCKRISRLVVGRRAGRL